MAISNLPQREEYLRKKKRQKQIKLVIFAVILLIIFGVFIYVSHRPEFRVSIIELEGGVLVTKDDVEKKDKEYLSGSYLGLFPADNAFWYPSKELKVFLKDSFKRIDTISTNLKGFKTLIINITERKPFAVWCNTVPGEDNSAEEGISEESVSEEDCYFIDQNGTIFSKAPNFSGDAYFKYYGIVSGDSVLGKEYLASSTEFGQIADFVQRTKAMSVKPVYIVAKEKNQFSMVLSGGGEIYFDTSESLVKVADNLEALLKTPELSQDARGNLPIQYIDLRYGNKLFYKLKQ